MSPMRADQLTTADIAGLYDISPATFRAYVSRGQAPKPDGYIDGRTPYWRKATIQRWRP